MRGGGRGEILGKGAEGKRSRTEDGGGPTALRKKAKEKKRGPTCTGNNNKTQVKREGLNVGTT